LRELDVHTQSLISAESQKIWMSRRVTKRAVENLLSQTRQLRERLAVFMQSVQGVAGPLDEILSEGEIQAMVTARAKVLGTLECLLADDLKPAMRKLTELDSLLHCDTEPLDLLREPIPAFGPFAPEP